MDKDLNITCTDLYRRYYQIGGVTIQFETSFPLNEKTIHQNLELFRIDSPLGNDIIKVRHHFYCPDLNQYQPKRTVLKRVPWIISELENGWLYKGVISLNEDEPPWLIAHFNHEHTKGDIYHLNSNHFEMGELQSLSFFPSDQILLSRILSDRKGCIIHSSGMIINGKGFLFVSHSEGGKSTTIPLLKEYGIVLCDDRNIIRKVNNQYRIYGTWSYGTVREISPLNAPLSAIFFIEKSKKNGLALINDKKYVWKMLLDCIVKPLITADWWNKMFDFYEELIKDIPFYSLEINKEANLYETIKDC